MAACPQPRRCRSQRRRRSPPPEGAGSARTPMDGGLMSFLLDPAFVLSMVVGAFHTCVYIFVRGKLGWHLPIVLVGAVLGALAGQAIGARIGDLLRIGDYSLLWASALAWVGIGIGVVTSSIVTRHPEPEAPPPGGHVRPRSD